MKVCERGFYFSIKVTRKGYFFCQIGIQKSKGLHLVGSCLVTISSIESVNLNQYLLMFKFVQRLLYHQQLQCERNV